MRKFSQIVVTIFLCTSILEGYAQVTIGGFNVYYGSLHNHTSYSDGQGTPVQAYTYARDYGQQDFFGLADHGEMLTSTEWNNIKTAANNANQDGTFTTFYGFEWSSFWSYGHVAIINTTDYCGYPAVGSFNSLLTWINSRNGVAFFNHPGWDNLAYSEFDHFTDTPSSKFVGMELWNDHDGFSSYYYNDGFFSNDGNKGYYDEALIRGWKIGASGSDDNHSATWGTATPMRMAVLASANNRTEIMNALIARRFYSTIDKNLGLSFKINGSEMGSSVTAGNYDAVISASDGDNEIFTLIQIIKNGSVMNSWYINDNNPVQTYNLNSVTGDYYYVKVTQSDGNEAISSPIFITAPPNLPPTVQVVTPINGANYNTGATVPINATATDPDGTISKVEFYAGTTKLGEDLTAPYDFSWINVQNGNYAITCKAIDNLGLSTQSSAVNITVSTPSVVIVTQRIITGNDDAEESKSGNVVLNSDDIELVYDTKTTGNQVVGLRFVNLGVPQGVTITKAYIQFTVDEKSTANCNLKIEGEATGNSQPFLSIQNNISQRIKTSSNVTWTPASWNSVGASSTAQQTPDIKNIIQEVVNRADYQTTGGISIFVTGTGKRVARSYEGSTTTAALLHIEYTAARKASINNSISSASGQKNKELEILAYPNPTNDYIIVKLNDNKVIDNIKCYNSSGKLIGNYISGSCSEFKIDCSEFKRGIYFLIVQSDNLTGVSKIIRE
ncbi:MAG: CehA/McbA family metallohydrolase [Chloroflexota bacterium]